jgi:hypothetical protein
VFRTTPSFEQWQPFASLRLRYFPGRPDAVGSYPAVQSARFADREGQQLLLATGGNGHVLLDHGHARESSFANQFGQRFQADAVDSPLGLLILPGDDREQTWSLARGRWSIVDGPPFRLSLGDSFARAIEKSKREEETWARLRFAVSPGGAFYAFTETAWLTGTRGVDRWQDGRFVAIATITASRSVEDYFFAPNDDLWVRDWEGDFQRLHDGKWQTLAGWKTSDRRVAPRFFRGLRLLTGGSPPWFYVDRRHHALIRFHPGDGKQAPSAFPIDLSWQGKKLEVLDALAESDRSLLLASEAGLLRYEVMSGALSRMDVIAEGGPVRSLVRDRKGRLWLLGKELYLLPRDGRRAQIVRGLPVSSERSRLIGTPAAHPDGVVVGLDDRGLLLVDVEP